MRKNSKPNPKAVKERPTFKIPKQFFAQLNEFSNGGFCLLLLNSKGSPVVFSQFDNAIIALGIRKYGLEYFKSLDILYKDSMMDVVAPAFESDLDLELDDEDDEDEDEEREEEEESGGEDKDGDGNTIN